MSEPLVSVVLPTHNRPEWLPAALESVLSGEFTDIEVIVSNNGNPAHTKDLAGRVTDPRVTWIQHERDSPMLEHFAAAMSHVRGTFVAVLHDDDWWSPHFLAALVPPLQARADAVLAFADHYVVRQDGSIDGALSDRYTRRWARADLAKGYHQPFFGIVARQSVPITGCVFRRDALPETALSPDVDLFFDVWMSYLLAQSGGAAYYHGAERLLYYRVHGGSASSARNLSGYLGAVRCREVMRADPQMREFDGVLRERLARDHLSAGVALLRMRARMSAREHLSAALRLHPSVKAIGGLTATWVVPGRMLERL